MSLKTLPVEITTQIVDEICGPDRSLCGRKELVRMRFISRQFDAVISRIAFPMVDLTVIRRNDKLMTRPIVKWLLVEKAKSLRRDKSPGAFAFILDASSFFTESQCDPSICEDDSLEAICNAIVSSNDPRTVFTKLILHATPDPSFYNLWFYRRRQHGQAWKRNERPELFYGTLQLASAVGSACAIESLMRSGVSLDYRHRVFGTAIRCAILCNKVNSVKVLVRNDIDTVPIIDGEATPPLLFAGQANRPQIAEFLLGLPNAPVHFQGKGGVTILLWAARRGWTNIVRDLLQREDLDPDPKTDWKETPVKAAARGGHEEVVRLFVDRQDIEPEFGDGKQSLAYYAIDGGSATITALLLDRYGIDPNRLVIHNKPALARAAELGHTSLVRMLLDREDVDINNSHGTLNSPAIVWAAMANQIEAAKLLLERKDLNLNLEGYGSTVLKKLVTRNYVEMARLLLDRRDLSPHVFQQALRVVARSGSTEMLSMFLLHERMRKNNREQMKYTLQEAVLAGRDGVLCGVLKRITLESEWVEYVKKSWRIQALEDRLSFSEQRFLR
ncbi:unnamed protein product [Clonostachys rosea f. rosea IK726]|uniref:Uncharacterized protein n=2 Tax=Bionectria ochroleuca TaxID=29856 RepID=A0A0B7KJL5_BIOOC|nr:unnamed protein product [Clonostachys rosea f. rosea IK726]